MVLCRTVRRICHGLPLRAGLLRLCRYIDHMASVTVGRGFARARARERKSKTDSARAPTCQQSYAYRVPCPALPAPRVTIVACPARAHHPRACLRACPSVPTGASACARSDCSPRVCYPNLTLGINPTAYSGISARIAALSALQATMEASFCRAASANSPLVRTAARSARGQSIRRDAGTPTSLRRSTI